MKMNWRVKTTVLLYALDDIALTGAETISRKQAEIEYTNDGKITIVHALDDGSVAVLFVDRLYEPEAATLEIFTPAKNGHCKMLSEQAVGKTWGNSCPPGSSTLDDVLREYRVNSPILFFTQDM